MGASGLSDRNWIDREEYPFEPKYLKLDPGMIHYIDEGAGRPVVMVHGTPDWSFVYRHLVKTLSPRFRCIAPDNLGFGLSDKPRDYSYWPDRQAKNLRSLIETLGLGDITLVLHDFGGPFGLAYAIETPENVRNLILMNTWMWSLRGDPHYERFAWLLGGRIGRFLYLRLNFSTRLIMKHAMADRSKLPPRIHQHYIRALPSPAARAATWAYAKAVIGASEWYDRLWQHRHRIRDKPTLILWGMRDIAFRERELQRLETVFTNARTIRFQDAGHFVQEEQPERVGSLIRDFLSGATTLGRHG